MFVSSVIGHVAQHVVPEYPRSDAIRYSASHRTVPRSHAFRFRTNKMHKFLNAKTFFPRTHAAHVSRHSVATDGLESRIVTGRSAAETACSFWPAFRFFFFQPPTDGDDDSTRATGAVLLLLLSSCGIV